METKLFFQNSKGNKLVGLLSSSSGNTTRPIIILVHGFSSNKNSKNFVKLVDILAKQNISTFRFDIYGHGESEGQFENITVSEAVDDILNAIQFLKKQGYSKIGLVGSSFGGISSIMAASKSKDLFLLALKSPVSNYEEKELITKTPQELDDWKKDGYRYYLTGESEKLKLNYTFCLDFKNNDGYKVAPLIQIPTLIVHGDTDEIVPASQSIKTSKLIPNCKLILIKGANHRYEIEAHAEEMLHILSQFIIDHSK